MTISANGDAWHQNISGFRGLLGPVAGSAVDIVGHMGGVAKLRLGQILVGKPHRRDGRGVFIIAFGSDRVAFLADARPLKRSAQSSP